MKMEPGAAYWACVRGGFPPAYNPIETDLYGLMFITYAIMLGIDHMTVALVSRIEDVIGVGRYVCMCV